MVTVKHSSEKAANINVGNGVQGGLCQEDLVHIPVGKCDLHLLPVSHPLEFDVTLLGVATGRSPGPPWQISILKLSYENLTVAGWIASSALERESADATRPSW